MNLEKFHHSPMGCNVEIKVVSIQFTSFWDVSMWQTVVFSWSFIGRKNAAYIPWFAYPTSPLRSVWDVEKTLHSEMSSRHACLSGVHMVVIVMRGAHRKSLITILDSQIFDAWKKFQTYSPWIVVKDGDESHDTKQQKHPAKQMQAIVTNFICGTYCVESCRISILLFVEIRVEEIMFFLYICVNSVEGCSCLSTKGNPSSTNLRSLWIQENLCLVGGWAATHLKNYYAKFGSFTQVFIKSKLKTTRCFFTSMWKNIIHFPVKVTHYTPEN